MNLLAPSLAAGFLGLLAFAAYLLHLRRLDAVKEAKALFNQDVLFLTATLKGQAETMTLLHQRVSTRLDELEAKVDLIGKAQVDTHDKVTRLEMSAAMTRPAGAFPTMKRGP